MNRTADLDSGPARRRATTTRVLPGSQMAAAWPGASRASIGPRGLRTLASAFMVLGALLIPMDCRAQASNRPAASAAKTPAPPPPGRASSASASSPAAPSAPAATAAPGAIAPVTAGPGAPQSADTGDTPGSGPTQYCSGKSLLIAKDEVIDGDRYFLGNDVTVDGKIDGDLLAAGKETLVRGEVSGDVNAACSEFRLEGRVGDDVRVLAGNLVVDGAVGGDLMAMGGALRITKGTRISGQSVLFVAKADLNGTFERDVRVGAGQVVFGGVAEKNVRLEADVVKFEESAHIKGNLTYTASQQTIANDAAGHKIVEGDITFVPKEPEKKEAHLFPWLWKFWTFASAFTVGCLLIAVGRGLATTIIASLQRDPLPTIGFGFLGHIFVPFAALILIAMCLTIPVGLLVLLVWGIVFYLSKLVVSASLGDWVLRRLGKTPSPYLALLLGMIPVWILLIGVHLIVPIVGLLISWLVVPILGIGAIVVGVRTYTQGMTPGITPPPSALAQSVAV